MWSLNYYHIIRVNGYDVLGSSNGSITAIFEYVYFDLKAANFTHICLSSIKASLKLPHCSYSEAMTSYYRKFVCLTIFKPNALDPISLHLYLSLLLHTFSQFDSYFLTVTIWKLSNLCTHIFVFLCTVNVHCNLNILSKVVDLHLFMRVLYFSLLLSLLIIIMKALAVVKFRLITLTLFFHIS